METIVYRGHTLTRWRVGNSTFLALPERGARLMNWNLTLGDGSVRDVIYWPEDADFSDFAKVRGGNPILFPFAGRTFDRGAEDAWQAPDGARRPMPRHGFARQGTFRVLWQDERGFAAQLVPDAESRAAYPYEYEFTVAYRFEPVGFSCEFTLRNLGSAPLPWSAGHHFYFTVPWSEGVPLGDYAIRIQAAQRLRSDPAGKLQPGPRLRDEEPLSNPDLIETVHTGLRSSKIVFGERGRPGDVVLRIGPDKVPPSDTAVVTWTTGSSAPFYCVEPWMGPPNAPEHHRGLHWVAPSGTESFVVSVNVH